MSVLGLVAGLILLLAGSDWFSGAHTVGLVITIASAVVLLFQLAWITFVAKQVKGEFRDF